jgi:hypothetical protein
VYAREQRDRIKDGTFKVDADRLQQMTKRVLELNPHAVVSEDGNQIRHRACGQFYTMGEPYNTAKFTEHVKKKCPTLTTNDKQMKKRQ